MSSHGDEEAQQQGEVDGLAALADLISSNDDIDDSDADEEPAGPSGASDPFDQRPVHGLGRGMREKRPPSHFHYEEYSVGRKPKVRKPLGRRGQITPANVMPLGGEINVGLPAPQLNVTAEVVDLHRHKKPGAKDVTKVLKILRQSLGWDDHWERNVIQVTRSDDIQGLWLSLQFSKNQYTVTAQQPTIKQILITASHHQTTQELLMITHHPKFQ